MFAAALTAAVATARGKARCNGISHREVRGTEPVYTRKKLARFRNSDTLCHGIWLPRPRRYFVPQGFAITGRNTAWISGFRYRDGYGKRPCQLMRVDLTTGRRVDFHRAIYGRVGKRPRTYCRHGGGILERGGALWVVEKNKLWLVDPEEVQQRAERPSGLAAQVTGPGLGRRRDREPDRAGAVQDERRRRTCTGSTSSG